ADLELARHGRLAAYEPGWLDCKARHRGARPVVVGAFGDAARRGLGRRSQPTRTAASESRLLVAGNRMDPRSSAAVGRLARKCALAGTRNVAAARATWPSPTRPPMRRTGVRRQRSSMRVSPQPPPSPTPSRETAPGTTPRSVRFRG